MTAFPPEDDFRVTDRRRRIEDEPVAGPEAPASPQGSPSERNLIGLFMMLTNFALIALGETPNPATGGHQQDLAGAADLIDLLVLLRERTDGRRLADETHVLEHAIYDLQMRYVNAKRRSG